MVRFTAVFFVSALALLAAANPVPSVNPVEDVVDLSTRDILEALETRAVDEMVDDLFERGHLDGELDFDLALRNLEEDLHARMDDLFERGILDGESATDLAERAEFEEGIEARNAKKFFGGLWRKIKGIFGRDFDGSEFDTREYVDMEDVEAREYEDFEDLA